MAKVKVLGKQLICPICFNDEWHATRIKLLGTILFKDEFVEQERRAFECVKCGYEMWFGVVHDYENDTYNIEIVQTDYDKQFDV